MTRPHHIPPCSSALLFSLFIHTTTPQPHPVPLLLARSYYTTLLLLSINTSRSRTALFLAHKENYFTLVLLVHSHHCATLLFSLFISTTSPFLPFPRRHIYHCDKPSLLRVNKFPASYHSDEHVSSILHLRSKWDSLWENSQHHSKNSFSVRLPSVTSTTSKSEKRREPEKSSYRD
jgi:hypothetical protein